MEERTVKVLKRKPSPSDLKNGELCIYFDKDRPVFVHKQNNKLWFSSMIGQDEIDLLRDKNVVSFLEIFTRAFKHGIQEGEGAGGDSNSEEGTVIECDTLRVRRKTVTAENQFVGLNPIGSSIMLTNSANIRIIDEDITG